MGLRITIPRKDRESSPVTIRHGDEVLTVRVFKTSRTGAVELEFDGPRSFNITRHPEAQDDGNLRSPD